jgi:hypothetical protein
MRLASARSLAWLIGEVNAEGIWTGDDVPTIDPSGNRRTSANNASPRPPNSTRRVRSGLGRADLRRGGPANPHRAVDDPQRHGAFRAGGAAGMDIRPPRRAANRMTRAAPLRLQLGRLADRTRLLHLSSARRPPRAALSASSGGHSVRSPSDLSSFRATRAPRLAPLSGAAGVVWIGHECVPTGLFAGPGYGAAGRSSFGA